MSMPKGFKASNGYATVGERGGLGYREIAEVMTAKGEKMKVHSRPYEGGRRTRAKPS